MTQQEIVDKAKEAATAMWESLSQLEDAGKAWGDIASALEREATEKMGADSRLAEAARAMADAVKEEKSGKTADLWHEMDKIAATDFSLFRSELLEWFG